MIENNSTETDIEFNGTLDPDDPIDPENVDGVGIESDGVVVEQGPEFVVDLFVNPPWWVPVGMVVIAIIVIALAALGYRRHGIDEDVLEEMLQIGSIVIAIAAVAKILAAFLSLPYVADVLCGTAIGYLIGIQLSQSLIDVCRPRFTQI